MSSRKKSPKKEESKKEETTQTSSEEEEKVDPSSVSAPGGNEGHVLELDVVAESEHVGKILELLCGLGAAYKYLCQVSLCGAMPLVLCSLG